VLLLLADGHSVRTIVAMLFCSFDLIASVRREYRRQGFDAALGTERSIERTPGWWGWLLGWFSNERRVTSASAGRGGRANRWRR